MKYFVVLALLGAASAFKCYSWTCDNLDDNVCAEFDGSVISVNEDGCESGYTCGLMDIDVAVYVNEATKYNCILDADVVEEDFTVVDNFNWASSEYCEDDSAYDLQEGSHPKICNGDEDCIINNGDETDCYCGFNGVGYCMPDMRSEHFSEWHKECEDGTADIDSYLEHKFHADYFFFIETIQDSEDYDCMNDFLYDFKDQEDYSDVDSANSLVFGLLATILLLA